MNIAGTLLAFLQSHPNQDLTLEQIRHGISPSMELTPQQIQSNIGLLKRKMHPKIVVVIRGNCWRYNPAAEETREDQTDSVTYTFVRQSKHGFVVLEDEDGELWKATKLT